MKALAILLVGLARLVPASGAAVDLPEAPDGFEWVVLEVGKCAFLKPDGWFQRKEEKNGTIALFITKQDIALAGRFTTGLSVNVITDVSRKTGLTALEYAATFIKIAQEKSTVVLDPWLDEVGEDITGLGIRTRLESEPVILVHRYLVADTRSDTLRILMFEAPESDWNESWRIGEKLLKVVTWQ